MIDGFDSKQEQEPNQPSRDVRSAWRRLWQTAKERSSPLKTLRCQQQDGDPPSRQQALARGSPGTHQNITALPGARRIHAGQNTIPHEEQRHLETPLDICKGGENSHTREHDPSRPTSDGHDGEAQGMNDEGDNPVPC